MEIELLTVFTLSLDGTSYSPMLVDGEPVELIEYTYVSARMGVSSVSGEVRTHRCLDELWTGREFVELRGERFFLDHVPSSSKSNEDERYVHSLEFRAGRDILLSGVYFCDAVAAGSASADRPQSNSYDVKFVGTLDDFVQRFNDVLAYRGLDERFSVSVESGIAGTTESKEIAFSDVTLFEALGKAVEVWEVPFYFEGDSAVFGSADGESLVPVEYGADKELLSVSMNNRGEKTVTRISGHGGTDNVPYYYPNPSPKGTLGVGGTASGVTIRDMVLFSQKVGSGDVLTYLGKEADFGWIQLDFGGKTGRNATGGVTAVVEDVNVASGTLYPFRVSLGADLSQGFADVLRVPLFANVGNTEQLPGTTDLYYVRSTERGGSGGAYLNVDYLTREGADVAQKGWELVVDRVEVVFGSGNNSVTRQVEFECDYSQPEIAPEDRGLYPERVLSGIVLDFGEIIASLPSGADLSACTVYIVGHLSSHVLWQVNTGSGFAPAGFFCESMSAVGAFAPQGWFLGEAGLGQDLSVVGLGQSGEPVVGSTITQTVLSYVTPTGVLMPSIYRQSGGASRFYDALNDTYTDPETGGYYTFEHEYDPLNPHEHVESFEDVYPTIRNLKDGSGNPLNVLSDVWFDPGFNVRDLLPDGQTLKYQYFFVKLKALGFNLFDCAIEDGEMALVMSDGPCAGCHFKILVNSAGKNPVQRNSNGTLKKDASGYGVIDNGSLQEAQQDTTSNNVWVALYLDDSTFGGGEYGTMPAYDKTTGVGPKPSAGDSFTVENILLPQAFFTAAEQELDRQLIKFMAEHNADKFDPSVTFSRVYLAQNPSVRAALSEKSRLSLTYDGRTFSPLYVSQFTLNVKEGEALPEIIVETSDIVEQRSSGLDDRISAITMQTVRAVVPSPGSDIRETDSRYLRKDAEDTAKEKIIFEKGLEVGDYRPGRSGLGGTIYTNSAGEAIAEVDFLTVRRKATFSSVEVDALRKVSGTILLSLAEMQCNAVEKVSGGWKCYFKTDTGEGSALENGFAAGDQAICQTFLNNNTHYYWRLVTEVGPDYIILSESDCDAGSDAPEVGDTIVQLGNRSDASRQAAQVLSCYGSDSPSHVMYAGINSYDLTGRDIWGVVYTQNGGVWEPRFYNYGSMLLGSRDKSGDYVEFDTQGGMTIKANVVFKAGQTIPGLSDLETQIDNLEYLHDALPPSSTIVDGGLILSTVIALRDSNEDIKSGINGDPALSNIAAWYGGPMADKQASPTPASYAQSLFRFDGTGYLAGGNITWNADGSGSVAGGNLSWDSNGVPTIAGGIEIGNSGSTIADLLAAMYFQQNSTLSTLVELKSAYSYLGVRNGIFFSGATEADFEVQTINGQRVIHSRLPFYSDGFISAGGISSGGGSAGGNATLVAQTYGGTLSATGISPINFYSKEKVDQLIATAGTVQTVAGVSPVSGDIPVTSLKSALGLGAAAAYGVGSVASGNTGLVTGGSVYSAINEAVSSVLKMQGTTTTAISDGSTTNPVVIDGSSYTAKKGDVVMYGNKEFWWTGSAWEELGDEASWALKTTTISAGTGLTGGGSLASNRTISLSQATIDSLALADTALQAHQTIYSLTIKNSAGTTQLTYTPNVEAGSITLTKAMVGLGNVENTALSTWVGTNKITTVGTIATGTWQGTAIGYNYVAAHYIGRTRTTASAANATLLGIDAISNAASSGSSDKSRIVWDSTNNAWHFLGNVYADGFVSAGGLSSGGGSEGASLAAVWASLKTNSDEYANEKINAYHIPIGSGLSVVNGLIVANNAGTVTSVKVGTTTYNPTDGVVSLPAYPTVPSTYALSSITGADDLKAIEALTGTSGFLKKTAANTWALDTNTYLTGITSSMVTTALGYTPANSTALSNYVLKSGDTMTGALTFNHTYQNQAGIRFLNTRAHESGAWAVPIIRFCLADGTVASNLGWYGEQTDPKYIYLGNQVYDGANFRVYADKVAFGTNTIFHQGNANLSTVNWVANQMVANSFKLASGTPTLTWDADANAWHLSGNFYADGFISAGGVSSGGGASGVDLAAVWANLTANTGEGLNKVINVAHIPALASLSGDLTVSRISDIETWISGKGYLTSHQSLDGYVNALTRTPSSGGNYVSSVTKSGKTITVTYATLPTSLPASDVYSWAKAETKPSYAFSEITGTASTSQIPTLAISKISGLQTALDAKADASSLASYVLKSGDTMTGSLTIDNSDGYFVKNFKYQTTTGWARTLVGLNVDGVSKFVIGAYGSYTLGASDNGINYAYIGVNSYGGTNLRFGSDSTLKWGTNTILHAGNYTSYTPILNSTSTHATSTSVIYAPTSVGTSGQVLISSGSGAPSWATRTNWDDYFGVDASGNVYVKKNGSTARGFYSYGFVSAGGVSSGGGTAGVDLTAVWNNLIANTGEGLNKKIHTAHLPTVTITGTNISGTGTYSGTGGSASTLTLNLTAVDTTYSAGTGISLSGTTFSNSGVRSTTIKGDSLQINTNGTITYLTIPYATAAGAISIGDHRDQFPGEFVAAQKAALAFMRGNTVGISESSYGTYYDTLIMRGWSGSSGGSDTAIFFAKGSDSVFHSRIPYGSTESWGTPILFLDSNNYTSYVNTTNFPGLNKVGTVTSVAAGTGLSGGTITTSGTISLAASGVTAGTYYKTTVDTYGRVTSGSYANLSAAINGDLSEGSSNPVDADFYIAQYAGGGTSTTSYHRRPHSALYGYIKGKLDSVYVPLTRTVNSKALSANITLTLDDIGNGSTRSLANYLPLTGGTLTGSLKLEAAGNSANFVKNITFSSTSGWARALVNLQVDGTTKFTIGGLGDYTAGSSNNGITYAYIGVNSYDGMNLRFGSDSTLKWGTNTIWHAGNSGSTSYSWACNTLTASGNIQANAGVTIANNQSYGGLDAGGTRRTLLSINSSNQVFLAYGASAAGYNTIICGQDISFNYGTSHASGMYLNSSGNVGIGTTSPAYKLDVNGTVGCGAITSSGVLNITGATGYSQGIRIHDFDGYSSIWFRAVNASGYDAGMWGITADSSGFRFRGPASTTATTPNDYVTIAHGGNVGIGTASPSQKLHVSGNILTTGYVAVGTGGTNSYVSSDASNNIFLHNSAGTPLVCDGLVVRKGATASTATLGNTTYPWAGITATSADFRLTYFTDFHIYRNNSGGSAGITYYPAAQTTNYWNVGADPSTYGNTNNYRFYWYYTGSYLAYLTTTGNFVATGAITAGSASDARLKTNIRPLSAEAAKRIVMALNPVTFTWNEKATKLYDGYKGEDLGMIAQEVEPYLPQAVGTIFEKYKRLDYTKVISPLVKVAQDHETRIRQLEAENRELRKQLNMN